MNKGTALLFGLILLVFSQSAAASQFIDLWLTPDQQGRFYYERNDFIKAANSFEDLMWKGLAYYAAQDFTSAAAAFSKIDSPNANYYLGNSLAHAGKFKQAIHAYQRALSIQADFTQAAFNLEWVQGILELSEKQYEDAGGTGGKLKADKIVFDDRAKQAQGEMSAQEARTQGLSDQQLEEMWMRRVQTTPGEFLQFKFYYQLQKQNNTPPE